MKKLFCILAVVAMIAGLSTSCEKVCTCKTSTNGVEVTNEVNLKDSNVKKCADLNSSTDLLGVKIEVKCTKK